jgi:hypothetical protein
MTPTPFKVHDRGNGGAPDRERRRADDARSSDRRWPPWHQHEPARGAASTVPMRAAEGRASFLGESSVGHLDPGLARS